VKKKEDDDDDDDGDGDKQYLGLSEKPFHSAAHLCQCEIPYGLQTKVKTA
jgi:hypothetical protein